MHKKKVLIIADTYDLFPELQKNQKQEWESKKSILFLQNTIQSLGYESIILEPKVDSINLVNYLKNFLEKKDQTELILFNLVEGFQSRNREAYIPSLGEFFGIAYTGSDSYSQSISLDKNLTKLIAREANIPTKKSYIFTNLNEIPATLKYPQFIKPNGEGSSLGISERNKVTSKKELEIIAEKLLSEFESIIIEDYLIGDELTLGVFGNFPDYRCSKVAKLNYPSTTYSEEVKSKDSMPETLSFGLNEKLERKIQIDSIELCKSMRISGYARLDWKCDLNGNPYFLEINLTPGLSRFYSTLPQCYESSFGNYSDLIKNILQFGYENYNTSKFFNYAKWKNF